jgi:hypothetical protein
MKYRARKFLLILLILWLPAQGVVAAFTPHCAHQSNADSGLHTSINIIADDYLHNVDHLQPTDGHMTANQGCEVNTLCHISCGTLITVEHSTNIPVSNSSLHQSRNVNTASFIPDLPQHPPRL